MKRLGLMAAVFLVASAADARDRRCRPTSAGARFEDSCAGYAFFEFGPASGAGMTGVCNTTAPTGAKGEAMTFVRATAATCTKGGLGTRTTGIANGDLILMASGQVRQEFDADSYLGVRVELAGTNLLLRYIEYANAAWADVGTPVLTGSQTDPYGGTTAVQFEDDDGAAYEGRSQAVTVSAGAAHTMHCYVKAGTVAEARITLDGTAASITGLSATTWSIVTVTDASSSGVSITAEVLVGDAVGDTGTVIFGGCQVETGSVRTSIIPTTSAAVTRNAETVSFAPTWPTSASISWAANFVGTTPASGSAAAALEFNGIPSLLNEAGGAWRWFCGGVAQTATLSSATAGIRTYSWHDGETRAVAWGPNITAPAADSDSGNKFATTLYIGGSAGNRPNAILSRVCVDPSATRCR
jgi:hypothetical protein